MTRDAPIPTAVAALLLTLTAGCSSPAEEPFDIVVDSSAPTVAGPDPGPEVRDEPATIEQGSGHLAGVVVDPAVRPIEGAIVRLPGIGLQQETDRDGSFGFLDLAEGHYRLEVEAAGHDGAATVVAVKPGEFTRAKVVLAPVPPPEPHHVTLSFEGYSEVSTNPLITGQTGCTACAFTFGVAPEDLRAIVLEATFDAPDVGNDRGFYVRFDGTTVLCAVCTGTADPMRIELRGDDLPEGGTFRLEAVPQTFPGYETQVHFHVYATAFYGALPPTGWSFVAGDR